MTRTSDMTGETGGSARAWAVVILLFLFMLINWADKAVIGLAAVPIIHELHLTHTQFGTIGSSFFLLFPISGIAVGFLVNRVRAKPILVIMALIWAVAQLPMAGTVGLRGLLLSRVALGAGEGPALPVALHAVYKWFGDKRRTLPASIVITGAPFGAGIIAPLIMAVIIHYTWHAAFALLGLAGLAWAIAWQIIGQEGRLEGGSGNARNRDLPLQDASSTPQQPWIPYRALILSRTALGVFIAGFAAYWALTLNVVWLAAYLVQGAGFTRMQAGWIIVLPALAQIVLGPAFSLLSQRLMMRGISSRLARGALAGFCVMAGGVAMVLMPLLPSDASRIAAVAIAFSIGGVIFPLGATLIAEITPASQRGAMLGVMNSIQTTAGLLAPIVMGSLVDLGADPASGFRTGFIMAGAFVFACGVIGMILMQPDADQMRFARLRQLNDVPLT
jgi:MFS family permease